VKDSSNSAQTLASKITVGEFKLSFGSVNEQVLDLRAQILKKAMELSPTTKVATSSLSPYYADLSTSRFAITSEDMDTPYDGLVALNVESEASKFTVMKDITISNKDQDIIELLTLHIKRLEQQPFDLMAVDSSLSPAFESLDYMIANLYYQKKYGQPLLGPILREKKKPPKYLGPHAYHRHLVNYLARTFSSTDPKALAATVVRLLMASFKMAPDRPAWTKWIQSRKSRVPTYEQLVHAGVAPDMKLKRYRSLFYQTEWDKFSSEGLIDLEADISEKQRTAVTQQGLDSLIDWAKITKNRLDKSVLAKANLVKQKRLTVATRSRNARTLESIVKEGILTPSQATYFSPFYIVTDGLNVSEGELLSRVKAVDNLGHYAFDMADDTGIPHTAKSAGIEYCKTISSGPAVTA
jgi:hypothetical protein